MVPVQPSWPCSRAAETQAVGQKVPCDKVVSAATRSHTAASCLWPTLCSEETLLELNPEGAKRDVMLPVTRVLALGECQRLWGFPEGNRRCPDTPQRCYTAVSLAGTWLVSQSEATPSEYLEKVDREFGHISGPSHLSGLFHSPLEQNSPLCGDGAWWSPRLTAGQLLGAPCLTGSISLPVQVPPQSPSSRSHLG